MRVIGGLFSNEYDLLMAIEGLQERGFDTMTVFGPDELFREPGSNQEWQRILESHKHTAGGTISGIKVNPRPLGVDDPSARTMTDDLIGMGVSEEEASSFVNGLDQGHRLLLVHTKAGRAEEAQQVLQEQGAILSAVSRALD
ncbi:MAG: hypothetical protein L0346_32025 [Chloroflexi bacterium]|nr:hypothetical protein [Chloroflexota bacterium]